jgi:GTP-binding protein
MKLICCLGNPGPEYKNTLINRLTKSNKAITHDMPGVTRDIASYPCEHNGHHFMILDSGGVLFTKHDDINMQAQIEELVNIALTEADRIIMVTDAEDGVHPLDKTIANAIRKLGSKVTLVTNKLDNINRKSEAAAFYELGLGDPLPLSAIQGHGIKEMLSHTLDGLPKGVPAGDMYKAAFQVAIVGRPNVGKSSLINAIMNEKRVLVDNVAGTTRDAIEVYFNQGDFQYVFIDTAGLRRKARVKEDVEFYSTVRSRKSIDRADLVIVVLDAIHYLSDQDKKIINEVLDAQKPMLIFVNKWDQSEKTDQARKDLITIAKHEMPMLENYPILFGSATEKHHIGKLINGIPEFIQNSRHRIPTGELNRFFIDIIAKNPPPSKSGKRMKVYYATQAESAPPSFILFVNNPNLAGDDYMRYIERKMRSKYPQFFGCPIQLYLKNKAAFNKSGWPIIGFSF